MGYLISYKSIPNQEGYFEIAWNLSYIDFKKTIMSAAVTPISFLAPYYLHKITQISLSLSWKMIDLFFAGLSASFLTYVYWENNKPEKLFEKISPLFVLLSSAGFIYSFTSMSGEGIPILFGLLGVYSICKKRYFFAFLYLSICMLSKFTFYLIAPGIIIWFFLNLRSFTKREIRNIAIYSLLFFIIFLAYHSFKEWTDIKLQFAYINSIIPIDAFRNFRYYFLAIILGAPIISGLAFFKPSFKNLYFLAALSALIMLSRRYFYWNHPQQVIMFMALYLFSSQNAKVFITKSTIIFQVLITVSVITLSPVMSRTIPIFFKHQTQNESRAIESEILKEYQGGKIGYYLNRAFDEPFPTYEISYLPKRQPEDVYESEYVVIPTVIGLPKQLTEIPACTYLYHKQTIDNTIFKVKCQKK